MTEFEDPQRDPQNEAALYESVEIKRLFISMSKMIERLTTILLLVLLLCVILSSGAFYLWWRTPEVITWKESVSGEKTLLTINNRAYGTIDNLSMAPQADSVGEKIFAAKELSRYLYAIEPDTRKVALERVLNWFRSDSSGARDLFAKALREVATTPNACVAINLERTQGWQSTFNVQEAAPSPENPNVIRVVGLQKLRRTLVSPNLEDRLLQAEIEIAKDSGLNENNLMTGYVPTSIRCQVLQTTVETSSASAPAPGTASVNPNVSSQLPSNLPQGLNSEVNK